MKTRGSRVVRRVAVIVAAMLVVGSYATGLAFAQITTPTIPDVTVPTSVIPTSVIPTSVIPTSVLPTSVLPTSVLPTSVLPTTSSTTCTGGILLPVLNVCVPTTLPGLPGSTTATGPSGSNTQIIYSPYPVPAYGDYGNRYYGRYRDSGCGCDRYAAPTYVAPATVVATQVASVPKGGVDTGDGSFQ